MTDRSTTQHPTAPPDIDAYLARFGWHPEPELVGYRDEGASRAALERLGDATWRAALDFLYGPAAERAMGDPAPYDEIRRSFFGERGVPGPAPSSPIPAADILEQFRARLAGGQMNAQHPRQFGYFTPPPLPISMMGELLAQMTNQGVDVWHAGPVAAFVEEEVVRWLGDLVGYGPGSFGLLTSGGVMANFMGMTIARDLHLGRALGLDSPPRGKDLEGARVYASDQTHFSVARALDLLGFPAEALVIVPSDDRFRLRGAPVAAAVARDKAAGLTPFAIAAVAGSTNTGSVDRIGELADVAAEQGLWLHVDAAYGGAARLSTRDAGRVTDLQRADSITLDPHKWFFQAYDIGGLLVRDGSHLAATFGGRSPEYYRGGESAGSGVPAADDGTTMTTTATTATSSTSTSSASRAPDAGGRSSSGCRGNTSAPRASDDSSRRTTTSPHTSRGDAPRPTTSRPSPRGRSSRSSASGTCPVAGKRRSACRQASSTPTRTDSSARSRYRATAG